MQPLLGAATLTAPKFTYLLRPLPGLAHAAAVFGQALYDALEGDTEGEEKEIELQLYF
ncbi:hypothetical protein [Spirosoma arboris]|uniref:hypothetical protein n=1 Tax=Spirosoma arboris TaxID=2682092 RepID=UPI0021CEA400|nr:hypothetical protein [Spirosoma arboris]